MAVPIVEATLATFVALVGVIILSLAPDRGVNRALFALLAIRAGALLAFGLLGRSPDEATALVWSHVFVWYSLASLLATAIVIAVAFREPGLPRPAARILVGIAGVLAIAGMLALVVRPTLFIDTVLTNGPLRTIQSGPLFYELAESSIALDAILVLVAARAAAASLASNPIERSRAVGLGLAFTLLPIHSGAFFATFAIDHPPGTSTPLFWGRAITTLACALLIVLALPRLTASLAPRVRRAALVGVALVAALGSFDAVATANPVVFAALPGYASGIVLVRLLFALALASALLRHDLARAGATTRAQVRAGARITLAVALAVASVGVPILLFGANALAFVAGGALAIAAPLVAWRSLGAAAERVTAQLLLPFDDPRARAERAARYASAVAAATTRGGAPSAEGERLLRALRADLGITEREHQLLLDGLASRERPAGDGALVLGRYRVAEATGAGATGSVLRATRISDGREVVVKRYHGRGTDQVLREARVLASVHHPRLVEMIEVDATPSGEVFLVLERVPGATARHVLDRDGPLPPARACGIVADALDALVALHAAGLVHRDVKAENLVLDEAEARATLVDLGSAASAQADATVTGLAVEGSYAGVSPEVLRGERATPASDVYACGALLYRLLTRQHYVELEDASAFDARHRVLTDAPRLPHRLVPPDLDLLIRSALAKRPSERPTAEALAHALRGRVAPEART